MIEYISPKSIKPFERNPRRISKDQFEKLCNNIKSDPDFFAMRPLLINKTKDGLIVYAGNQRLRAAIKIGLDKVPCVIESDLPEALMKKRLVLDNITHGEFDYDLLAAEFDMDELLDLGMQEKDLDIFNIQNIESETEEDSEILEPCKDEDAITKLGDIYEFNGHRLICGDSTDPDVVAKCLNGAEPILMVTDPPYGVEYDASWRIGKGGKAGKHIKSSGKVQNDDKINWSLAWHLFPGSIAYIWHAGKYCGEVEKSLINSDYEIISQIIWVKQNFSLSRGDYHWQHEPCWYAVKKDHKHNWQGARDQSTTWEISSTSAFGASKNEDMKTAHSTQKPIECMARPIRNNTAQGEGVYDCFMGSGTTLIAAEQLGRICYGIELSPAYCDIIVDRWRKYMIKSNKEFTIKKNGENVST